MDKKQSIKWKVLQKNLFSKQIKTEMAKYRKKSSWIFLKRFWKVKLIISKERKKSDQILSTNDFNYLNNFIYLLKLLF